DGWIPSLGYASPSDLGRMSRVIDAAAGEAGRDPSAIRRAFNVSGAFGGPGAGLLQGPPAEWADQLTELVLEHGISVFVLSVAPGAEDDLRRFAGEVAPAVREAVEAERGRTAAGAPPRETAASTPA